MTICTNCAKEYKAGKSSYGKYCSNKCQILYQRKQKLAKVELGTASAGWVKTYLLAKHGPKCMDPNCVWDFEKRPIPVELEHIDGNGDNNTLENCILLCPNCHSMTPTFKGRNRGKGRYTRRQRYAAGKSS
jgi:hypothetical protein